MYRRDTETATTERRSTAVGGVRCAESNTNGERPTGYWFCSSVGFCERLITALHLLANRQKDGDDPIQSIVTGPRERSRKGIMDGLRIFIEEDNHSAVDVGHLRRGTRPFSCPEAEFQCRLPRGGHEEGADELTLRAEEVKTLKACINIDHNEENSWGPPLVEITK